MDTIEDLTEKAWQAVDPAELLELTARMVDIPSPSGEEAELAGFLGEFMNAQGLEGDVQAIQPGQANAVGRYAGAGSGTHLMLYAPIDTAFAGRAEEDSPWIDLEARPDQVAKATVRDGVVQGLGAHNPKGHGACALMAAVALARAQIPLSGHLTVALCAGGMPTNGRPGRPEARRIGHGVGCAHLLEQGGRPDCAVVAKPGGVSYEEVGVSWFRVRVKGVLGYAGTRHVVKHRNPILDAAKVVEELEAWFKDYTHANTSGLVAPQGSIGCIRAGWPNKPTFIPEACDILIDLRVSPRTDIADVRRQFQGGIEAIAERHPDMVLEWDMLLGVPGSHTDPDHPVIRSTIRGWEYATGEAYSPQTGGSGATEANVLRQWGVPTARVGMTPPPRKLDFSGQFSMGEAHVESMKALTRTLIYTALDLCHPDGTKVQADEG